MQWVASHLEIRDYFIYMACLLGCKLFSPTPNPKAPPKVWRAPWPPTTPAAAAAAAAQPATEPAAAAATAESVLVGEDREGSGMTAADQEAWVRWATGRTGLPLIDAAMRELVATGYTSNRCRQNCVSVLANDLQLDWRLGAEWFQFWLTDHDVACNWGNWAYFAGAGFDPKARYFRTLSQARKHDPEAEFVRLWCAELRDAPTASDALWPFGTASEPLPCGWAAPSWPVPLVAPRSHLTWQDQQELDERLAAVVADKLPI